MIGTPGSALDEFREGRPPHAVSRGCGDDDRQPQSRGRLGQRDNVMLQLSRRIVANPSHETDLMVDEDERGVFGC